MNAHTHSLPICQGNLQCIRSEIENCACTHCSAAHITYSRPALVILWFHKENKNDVSPYLNLYIPNDTSAFVYRITNYQST